MRFWFEYINFWSRDKVISGGGYNSFKRDNKIRGVFGLVYIGYREYGFNVVC